MLRSLARWSVVVVALVAAGCGQCNKAPQTTPPEGPPGNPPVVVDPVTQPDAGTPVTTTGCAEPAPGPDYECVQACGPPVAREGDPEPPWNWLSKEEAERKRMYGCPRCLPPNARIATPSGLIDVALLRAGDRVWSLDATGQRIDVAIEQVASVAAPRGHRLIRVVLADGRRVSASAGHPIRGGKPLGELTIGDVLDGSPILALESVVLTGGRTFDLLPAGATHSYWADGILLGSTLDVRR